MVVIRITEMFQMGGSGGEDTVSEIERRASYAQTFDSGFSLSTLASTIRLAFLFVNIGGPYFY